MAVTLVRGQELTKDDLNIYIYDESANNAYFSPFRITYTIYRVISDKWNNQLCGEEPLLETIDSIPLPFGIGQYFAPWQMSTELPIGPYRIKWNIKKYQDSPYWQEEEEFEIVSPSSLCVDEQGGTGNGGRNGPFIHTEYQGSCF